MRIVYKARDIAEAHIVSGLLHSQDIENHVNGFYLQGAIGDIGASDFANVQVLDADFVEARQVVTEYERGLYDGRMAEEAQPSPLTQEAESGPMEKGHSEQNSLTNVAASGVRLAVLMSGIILLAMYLLLA